MLTHVELHCPYCGESFETAADTSAGDADYVEDCQVCCRPIRVRLRVDDAGELASFDGLRDD